MSNSTYPLEIMISLHSLIHQIILNRSTPYTIIFLPKPSMDVGFLRTPVRWGVVLSYEISSSNTVGNQSRTSSLDGVRFPKFQRLSPSPPLEHRRTDDIRTLLSILDRTPASNNLPLVAILSSCCRWSRNGMIIAWEFISPAAWMCSCVVAAAAAASAVATVVTDSVLQRRIWSAHRQDNCAKAV